jgi:uncharacterized membrane protein (DUF4010 family)
MILFVLYFAFLTAFSVLGGLVGYVADARYPGTGSLVTVAIFMIALWGAWTISVRLTERYWPEPPAA